MNVQLLSYSQPTQQFANQGVSDAQDEEPPQEGPRLAVAQMDQAPASGKGDMLVVNREGKGSLLNPPTQKFGQVDASQ